MRGVQGPRMGKLDNQGIYTVNYDDTLSSIAQRFGYLPSMIAAENSLEDPYWLWPVSDAAARKKEAKPAA